ncbi:Membrane protein involved in the export of O-antigen and teichoic acid [Geodermatophilus nigrescens]|uniref:Membrane protein involved in the export of O-antigen and teichoic acid n=1 Tax=Geodermatophilus nigrescens TaxID=1070870 RepID=A0A1M5D6H0_9ACTN|nr:Membrane protein involved in the export of O-antigen and teichoic acid [Geodermatophilus nigrescens]
MSSVSAVSVAGGRRGTVVRLARRAGWGVVDQALSSFSNLALSLVVARAVDAHDFGAFTVAFSVFSVAVLLSRSLTGQPLAIRFAGEDAAAFRRAAGSSTGTALTLGAAAGAAVVVLGLVLGDTVGPALVTVGLLLPALLLHDSWRAAFAAQGRQDQAALIDGAWVVLQLAGVAALWWAGVEHTVLYLAVWGGASACAAVFGALRGRAWPQVSRTASWLRAHWDMTRFLLFESMLVQGAMQGALLLVGVLGSLSAVGALRGAAVLVGPVSLVAMSAFSFCVPELARRRGLPARRKVQLALAIGTVMAAVGLAWGVVALVLPDAAGVALLGDSWPGVESVLWPTVIGQIANLFAIGATCVLLSMGATRAVFGINATVAVLLVVLGVGGLLLGGAVGAAWGFMAAYWLVMPLSFRAMWRLVHRPDAAGDTAGDTAVAGTPDAGAGPGAAAVAVSPGREN